jgi:hypothetical protein
MKNSREKAEPLLKNETSLPVMRGEEDSRRKEKSESGRT